jgi:hypothetical protein
MSSVTLADKNFNARLAPFAQNAWSRFPAASRRLTGRDLQEAIENWSRQESRTFYHMESGGYQFVRIYSALARFANVQIGLAEQRAQFVEAAKQAKTQGNTWTDAMKQASKAEQNKIMAATVNETVRVKKSPAFYEAKLAKFVEIAWTRYNSSKTDIANWAREEARTFYHLCDGAYPFISAWNYLTTWGEARQARQDVERQERRQQVAQEATRDFRSASETQSARATEGASTQSFQRDAALALEFAEDGEQTAAERRAGRAELNRILFREHSRWWDAFEAEAAEDMEEDSPDASERFSQHCAKIISRRTGLRDDVIAPVVGAWLLEKFEA